MFTLLRILREYRNCKIAVYGLSKETERVLSEMPDEFQIVGILDGYKQEGSIYGKRIISIEQAIHERVDAIIVVARPGSCRVISNRIGAICRENRIALYDMWGNDLNISFNDNYNFKNIRGVTREQLMQSIGQYDVVSFDLFDTLIMRKTLFASDVLEIVENRLKQKNIYIKDFSKMRLNSEQELAQVCAPTLLQIYNNMSDKYMLTLISPKELAELEWKVEQEVLVPRNDMCVLLENICADGKKVYIVSDTYYTEKQVRQLLKEYNIKGEMEVLCSCEYGVSKTQGLYDVLLKKMGSRSCLHIGDDEVTDVREAQKHGIATVRISSGIELFEKVGYLGLLGNNQRLENRIKLGMIVANLFNSPFQFESEKADICIKSAYDLGYLFFAPVISDFVLWFDYQIQKKNIMNIWFCARDGYLIKQLYDMLDRDPLSIYFMTSRIAAIRAGIRCKEDIDYVNNMGFSGSLKSMMSERYGIQISNNEKYKEVILHKAKNCRRGYKKYIADMKLNEGAIAFFDFVSSGTSQMFLKRLVDNTLEGFYFIRIEENYKEKKDLNITSFYEMKKNDECNELFKNYYILETILTSQSPSLKEINEQGEFIYQQEMRTNKELECIEAIQEGIRKYFLTYKNLHICYVENEDRELDEKILGLIHKLKIDNKTFLELKLNDIFFHRITKMEELI